MDRTLMTRQPSHPGEILKMLYMEPLGLTITDLAEKFGVSRKSLSALINGKTSLSVEMAMRLSKAFNTTPESWLNSQMNIDIWKARQVPHLWKNIQPITKEMFSENNA